MPYVKRKPRFKKPLPSFAKRVRKVISATAQLKHATSINSTAAMDSDVMYFTSPTQNIARGTHINERIADQVKLKYLRISGALIASPLANAVVKFRVAVFYCADGKSASSVTAGAFTATELFQPNTASSNTFGMWDEKYVRILADMVVDINSSVSSSLDLRSIGFTIPLKNQVVNYKESGSAFAAKNNLYVSVTGYSPNSAQVLDVGTFTYSYDLAFTDI